MRKRKLSVWGIVGLSILGIILLGFIIYPFYNSSPISSAEPSYIAKVKIGSSKVPEGYIAVFNGGAGEVTHSTYVYKLDNDSSNYGFEYVNTTNMTKSWGSSEWVVKVTGKGRVNWTQDVFDVAEKNGAYSYVLKAGESKAYTIEEFGDMFLQK